MRVRYSMRGTNQVEAVRPELGSDGYTRDRYSVIGRQVLALMLTRYCSAAAICSSLALQVGRPCL